MRTLELYSTSACHLCDQALAIIKPYEGKHFNLKVVDIADSDSLLERYGIRIPVVKFTDSEEELGWPFSNDEFASWLLSA